MAVAELYARARRRAIVSRSPHGCLIAVTAIGEDGPLLHDDRDYEDLAAVKQRFRLVLRK